MPGIAVGLILAVVLYEFLVAKKPAAPVRTTAAAAAGRTTATGAAQVTNSLSTIEKALGQLLGGGASSAPKSSGGGGGSLGGGGGTSGGGQAARPSQTGFNQPSNQDFSPTNVGQSVGALSVYGTDKNGNPVLEDQDGNIFDQNGNVLTDLSQVTAYGSDTGVFAQSAPGDGGWSQLDQQMGLDTSGGNLGGGNQDTALAWDAVDAQVIADSTAPDTSGGDVFSEFE
jgi:hypothetical protein